MSSKTAMSSLDSLAIATGFKGVKAALSSEIGERMTSPPPLILFACPSPTLLSCETQIREEKQVFGRATIRRSEACLLFLILRNPGAL